MDSPASRPSACLVFYAGLASPRCFAGPVPKFPLSKNMLYKMKNNKQLFQNAPVASPGTIINFIGVCRSTRLQLLIGERVAAVERQLEAEDYAAAIAHMGNGNGTTDTTKPASSSSINIAKIKLLQFVTVQVEKLNAKTNDIADKTDMVAKMEIPSGEGFAEQFAVLIAELRASQAKANGLCAATKTYLTEIQGNVDSCISIAAADDLRKQASKLLKEMMKDAAMKDFASRAKNFKRVANDTVKAARQSAAAAGQSVDQSPAPPINAILASLAADDTCAHNISTSIFEAKGGLRAAFHAPKTGKDPETLLKSTTLWKNSLKNMRTHLRGVGNVCVAKVDDQKPKLNKMMKVLKDAFDPTMFSSISMPEKECVKSIFNPDFFGSSGNHINIGYNPMGFAECRYVFEGKLYVAGFNPTSVPGETLIAKREANDTERGCC